jgi:chromosome segregation ATPase
MFPAMEQLEHAEQRLASALDRLEAAAARVTGSKAVAAVDGELAALRERCESLEARNREITQRLDTAIVRLQRVLDADEKAKASNGAG